MNNSDTTETEKRFIDLETKISHQDLMLEELHEVLYKQQAEISFLQKKLKVLEEQFSSSNEIRPAGEKPPHY